MTLRDRHTSEEPPAHEGNWTRPASASASVPPNSPGSPSSSDVSSWTDWYQRASVPQQQEALQRCQQGVLYSHQLAAPARSSAPQRSLLFALLNGQVKELEPLNPPPLEFHDGQLDRVQREAVARALATPDICLIQGQPGTGKSRLTAEIILQAARKGERVLFVAATSATLDCVLERLSQQPTVCPIRCLAPDEKPSLLPEPIARLTVSDRLRVYRDTTVPAARNAREDARKKLQAHPRQERQWERLQPLVEQNDRLAERLRSLTARRQDVSTQVESSEPSVVFGAHWQAREQTRTTAVENLDGRHAGLRAELETITDKQARLESEWESIQSLAQVRGSIRFWTTTWWRSLLRSGLREQVQDLETRRTELQAARLRLEQDLEALRKERLDTENSYALELQRLRNQETARRQAELDSEIAVIKCEQDSLRQQWRAIHKEAANEDTQLEISQQSFRTGREAWEQRRRQEILHAEAAEQWLQTVEDGVQSLPRKLAACANLIAATTSTLDGQIHLGDAPVFDLLIVEEAHQVTESDFASATRRARRWVLIGEPSTSSEMNAIANRKTVRSAVPRLSLFHRLWQNLHADPHALPFVWCRREDRLVCRLRPFSHEHAKWIETEPVVDRPEIEVRILSLPRQTPQIVEVLFPACTTIVDAKQFLYRELEELAVETRGRCMSWSESSEEVILEFAPCDGTETVPIDLESGVRERVACVSPNNSMSPQVLPDWHTCSLVFSRAAGWTRQSAEVWIVERLALRSAERTILLTVPHRPDPPTARATSTRSTGPRNQTAHSQKNLKRKAKDICDF